MRAIVHIGELFEQRRANYGRRWREQTPFETWTRPHLDITSAQPLLLSSLPILMTASRLLHPNDLAVIARVLYTH